MHFHKGSGCWSYLGRLANRENMISIDTGCEGRGTIQHETMHALGFHHEQVDN